MILFSESRLREYLANYGADIDAWPDDVRPMGRWAAAHHPEFAALIDAEARFEALLSERRMAPPHTGLSERIIAAAYAGAALKHTPMRRFLSAFTDINPTSLAAMLVLGFAIGFGTFMTVPLNKSYSMQSYVDDEGAFL